MPRYSTVIKSTWSVEDAFAFMSDFGNAQHWDPGVLSARRIDTGAVREGSAFDLVVVFAGRKVRLRYAVRTIEAAQRVVLVASTSSLESVDTLTFSQVGDVCLVAYDAEVRFKGFAAVANPLLGLGFRRIGDRARDSLRAVLTTER